MVNVGNTSTFGVVRILSPGSIIVDEGNQPSLVAKTIIKITPIINSGIEIAKRLPTLTIRSNFESGLVPARIPQSKEDGTAIRRRRVCACERKERFTTFERVQFRELTVIKNNGQRAPFDRDKITKSINIALRKRPIDNESIEKFISKIVRNLEGLGENEIPTSTIGKFIMDGLANLDQVAYVRFASVYKNFKEAKDFEQFIGNLNVYKKE